jgi:PAS domain-containing protein
MKEDRAGSALRVSLIYALLGVTWILLTDQLLDAISRDHFEDTALKTLWGAVFIFGSTVLIFFLLRREFKRFRGLEQARQESERTLLTLMGDLPGMAYRRRADPSWSMDFVSEGCKELTGHEPSALMRDEIVAYFDLIHPEDQASLWRSVQDSLEQNRPYQLVYRINAFNDVQKWVLEQGQGVYSPEGELICLGGFITDVTERIEAEQEVRRRAEQQEAFNAIVAASSKAVDLSHLLISVLQNTLKVFKLSLGVVWVLDYTEVQGLSPSIGEALIEKIMSSGYEDNGLEVVPDWGDVGEESNLSALQDFFSEVGIQASLRIPVLSERRFIGCLLLADEHVHEWSEEEVELGKVIANQLGSAAERLVLLGTIQEQAHLLQRILDTVREGIFTLDSERRILVANPSARTYLGRIAGVGPGEILKKLGGRSFDEFLTPRKDGLPHEIEMNGKDVRVFEIYPNPVEVNSQASGCCRAAGSWHCP